MIDTEGFLARISYKKRCIYTPPPRTRKEDHKNKFNDLILVHFTPRSQKKVNIFEQKKSAIFQVLLQKQHFLRITLQYTTSTS